MTRPLTIRPVRCISPVLRLPIFTLLLSSLTLNASAGGLDLSGFARIVAGTVNESGSDIGGYSNDVSLNEQSLIALQPSYTFSDQWTVTAQLLAHSNADRESGLEWLYLSYHPSDAWLFRAGKLRMPFFTYSDSIDVGYSYPWVTAPVQVYNNYLFSTFNGVSGSYNMAGEDFALNLEAYAGYFDDEIYTAGSRLNVDAKVSDLRGLVLNLNSHNVGLRLSYHAGYNETDIPNLNPLRLALTQAGFTQSAESLNSDGDVIFTEAALRYDTLRTFWKAEWVNTRTEFDLAPELTSHYFTGGFYHGSWTFHLTYATSSYAEVTPQDELAPHASNPMSPLFELANGYYQVFQGLPDGSMQSYTAGARWDFRYDMAFKADISYLKESAPRSGFFEPPASGIYSDAITDRKNATLFQLGWEWIF